MILRGDMGTLTVWGGCKWIALYYSADGLHSPLLKFQQVWTLATSGHRVFCGENASKPHEPTFSQKHSVRELQNTTQHQRSRFSIMATLNSWQMLFRIVTLLSSTVWKRIWDHFAPLLPLSCIAVYLALHLPCRTLACIACDRIFRPCGPVSGIVIPPCSMASVAVLTDVDEEKDNWCGFRPVLTRREIAGLVNCPSRHQCLVPLPWSHWTWGVGVRSWRRDLPGPSRIRPSWKISECLAQSVLF